jgi:hypothetical protein
MDKCHRRTPFPVLWLSPPRFILPYIHAQKFYRLAANGRTNHAFGRMRPVFGMVYVVDNGIAVFTVAPTFQPERRSTFFGWPAGLSGVALKITNEPET